MSQADSKGASHTPGPWKVRENPGNPDQFFVQAPRLRPSDPYDIEVMGEDTGDLYPLEMRRADARLIAAAPELLEACKEALTRVPETSKTIGPMLRAAIAKAEGRTNA